MEQGATNRHAIEYSYMPNQGILKGEISQYCWPSVDWFVISCMTTDNFCFYVQNRLIQTSQTGGQWYSDTSPKSIPWPNPCFLMTISWPVLKDKFDKSQNKKKLNLLSFKVYFLLWVRHNPWYKAFYFCNWYCEVLSYRAFSFETFTP
jgi:hypothetical protein